MLLIFAGTASLCWILLYTKISSFESFLERQLVHTVNAIHFLKYRDSYKVNDKKMRFDLKQESHDGEVGRHRL